MSAKSTPFMLSDLGIPVNSITDNLWAPRHFKGYQLRDFFEFYFEAQADTPPGASTSVMRLMSNRDVHLYGELILHDGAIRSFDTLRFSSLEDSSDIASFRSGANEGEERLRILASGAIASGKRSAIASGWVIGGG